MPNKVAKLMDGAYKRGELVGFDMAKEVYTTYYLDVMLITLHEKLGLEPEQVKQFFEDFSDMYDAINDEATEDTKDKEYIKEKIDQLLKASVPEDYFVPFEKRYKYDLTEHYDYNMKKWVYRYKNFD